MAVFAGFGIEVVKAALKRTHSKRFAIATRTQTALGFFLSPLTGERAGVRGLSFSCGV